MWNEVGRGRAMQGVHTRACRGCSAPAQCGLSSCLAALLAALAA